MNCSKEFLTGIVEKSAYLHERITSRFIPRSERPNESEIVQQRMSRWLRNASLGNAKQFEKRLSWDGLTMDQAHAIVTGVRLADPDESLPEWTATIESVLLCCEQIAGSAPRQTAAQCRFIRAYEPCAFEHLMIPFVVRAADRIREQAPRIDAILSGSAQANLERHLLQWLCAVSAETIELEFSIFKAVGQRGSILGATWSFPGQETSTKMYDAFVSYLWTGGLLTFFEEYAAI